MPKVIIDKDLEDLIPGYLENRKKDIVSIENALPKNNFDEIQNLGHRMKGSGGGYGFQEITEIGKTIEDAAKEKNTTQIKNSLDQLKDYLNNIEIEYS